MMQRNGWIAIAALVMASAGVSAQGPGGGFGFGGGCGPGGGFGPGGGGKPVTGEPFSASSTSSSVDKLADGATITHNSTMTEARDSQGRTVRTVTSGAGGTSGSSFTRTTVFDPVAHTVTTWSSQSTVATVMQLPNFGGGRGGNWEGPPPGGGGRGGPSNGGRPHPETTRVTLSPKTIAGVPAEGVKITTAIPVGAEGNDKPLVSTREIWTSTDLKIPLLEISDSPREGFHKMEVTSLSENEPNASLFQVPQGYTVKQENRRGRK